MKLFFLMNPSRPQRDRWRPAALQTAQRYGHIADVGIINRDDPYSMENLLQRVFAENYNRVVAVGGDGTFNRLIQLLAKYNQLAKMEVGLVPAGTCNDFLRSWRLPARRILEAIRLACTGRPQETDLGELNHQLFLNNAGFGRRIIPATRRRISALKTLRQFEAVPLRATWEQGSLEGPFFMGLVCNAPFFSRGLHFSRQVLTNDGLLDVFLVPKIPKAKLAAMLLLGRLGRPLRSRQLVTLRVNRIEMETEKDLWPQLDGEPQSSLPVRHLHFAISKLKAWIVR